MGDRSVAFEGVQLGLEVTPGLIVPATVRLLATQFEPKPVPKIAGYSPWGTKADTLVHKGKETSTSALTGYGSYTDIIYHLASALCKPGAPVASGADGFTWTFNPSARNPDTPQTFSAEVGGEEGADTFGYGLITDYGLKFSGTGIDVSGTMIGQVLNDSGTMTEDVPDVAPVAMDESEVSLYLSTDPAALMGGGTQLDAPDNAAIKINGRWAASMYLNASQPSFGSHKEKQKPDLGGDFELKQDSQSIAQLARLRAGTPLYFTVLTTGALIDVGIHYSVQHSVPIYLITPDRGNVDDLYTGKFEFSNRDDPAFGLCKTVVTNKLAGM